MVLGAGRALNPPLVVRLLEQYLGITYYLSLGSVHGKAWLRAGLVEAWPAIVERLESLRSNDELHAWLFEKDRGKVIGRPLRPPGLPGESLLGEAE